MLGFDEKEERRLVMTTMHYATWNEFQPRRVEVETVAAAGERPVPTARCLRAAAVPTDTLKRVPSTRFPPR
jgi:hypothetical protein